VGAGGSQEAPYPLKGKLRAGTYHCVLDAIIVSSVDVTFDLIWRHASGDPDTILAEWGDHYDPRGGGLFDAQPFEYDELCAAVDTQKGDQLVFRYAANAASQLDAYIPNGDGARQHGRIPNITLP
jgi:hypothetical protein